MLQKALICHHYCLRHDSVNSLHCLSHTIFRMHYSCSHTHTHSHSEDGFSYRTTHLMIHLFQTQLSKKKTPTLTKRVTRKREEWRENYEKRRKRKRRMKMKWGEESIDNRRKAERRKITIDHRSFRERKRKDDRWHKISEKNVNVRSIKEKRNK